MSERTIGAARCFECGLPAQHEQPRIAPFKFVQDGRSTPGDFLLGRTDLSARIRQAERSDPTS